MSLKPHPSATHRNIALGLPRRPLRPLARRKAKNPREKKNQTCRSCSIGRPRPDFACSGMKVTSQCRKAVFFWNEIVLLGSACTNQCYYAVSEAHPGRSRRESLTCCSQLLAVTRSSGGALGVSVACLLSWRELDCLGILFLRPCQSKQQQCMRDGVCKI